MMSQRARRGRPALALSLLLALAGAGLCQTGTATTTEPPTFPHAKRVFSMKPGRREISLFKYIFLHGKGLKRIVNYIASVPGQTRVRVYKFKSKPPPSPIEVHEYYSEWAKKAGYHLLVEVRLGGPLVDPMKDDWDRPYKPPPPGPPLPWEGEDPAWVDGYYRPGPDGGIFLSVWTKFQHIWVWKPGHCPVAPALGEWLGLPRVTPDMTPPTEVVLFPEAPGFPPMAEDQFYIRIELGKWELTSLCADLQARASLTERKKPVEALFSVAPITFAPVRHVWLVTFRDLPEKRAEDVLPWVAWAEARGWGRLPIAEAGEANVRGWFGSGPDGGALAMFDVKDTTSVLVFDGSPNLLALLPVLSSLKGGLMAAPEEPRRERPAPPALPITREIRAR
jgi:hypothetical protein